MKIPSGSPAYHWALNLSTNTKDPTPTDDSIEYDTTNSIMQGIRQQCPLRTRRTPNSEYIGSLLQAFFTIAGLGNMRVLKNFSRLMRGQIEIIGLGMP